LKELKQLRSPVRLRPASEIQHRVVSTRNDNHINHINKDHFCRCTDPVEELVTSERSATAAPATATTATQQDDSQGSGALERDANAEAGVAKVQAEEATGLGQHDEGGRERQEAEAREMQRPERASHREGEQGHG